MGIRLGGILALALAVSGLAVMLTPMIVLYPDWCSTGPAPNGQPVGAPFCIRYDPTVGRYENPPSGVPADISAAALHAANPDQGRVLVAVIAFVATLAVVAVLLGFRGRDRSAPGTSAGPD